MASDTRTQHTPGPWQVHHGESGRVYIEGPEGDIGVLIHYEHAEADARLIAAAPDLLAALEEFMDCFDSAESADGYGFGDEYRAGRAAIAKARGQ